MNRQLFLKKTLWIVTFAAAGLILLHASQAGAAIGKITAFKGDVIIKSGEAINQLTKVGALVNDSDTITTQKGEASIIFNDGAVMKISPYTSAQITERKEESGFWMFKKTYNSRRITCIVGKFWFKSGASDTRNTLQSPVAVATLRGSDGDFGFDNLQTYLNMYSGDAAVIGSVIRGFFENPGISAAQKNSVYQSLQRAYQQTQQAQATAPGPLRAVAQAQARIAALEEAKQVAEIMKKNPDATVADQANQALTVLVSTMSNAQNNLDKVLNDAKNAGITVPVTTTVAATTVPATTTAASTTSTTTTTTTSTTSSISTSTICASPPCK